MAGYRAISNTIKNFTQAPYHALPSFRQMGLVLMECLEEEAARPAPPTAQAAQAAPPRGVIGGAFWCGVRKRRKAAWCMFSEDALRFKGQHAAHTK